MSAASSPLTRWGWPGSIIWAGLMLSAWVHTEKLPPKLSIGTVKIVLLFVGVPALQVLSLWLLRKILTKRGDSRGADLMVLWLMTFLFGLHATLLGTAVGLITSVGRGVPVAVALLMLGIAPALAYLEPNSPMGIRTPATLASPSAWRRTHRFAAIAFVVAGLLAPLGLLLPGVDGLLLALAPAVLAVGAAIVRGATVKAS